LELYGPVQADVNYIGKFGELGKNREKAETLTG
jgi:hypothetical protein